jgi:hypothetical protein
VGALKGFGEQVSRAPRTSRGALPATTNPQGSVLSALGLYVNLLVYMGLLSRRDGARIVEGLS